MYYVHIKKHNSILLNKLIRRNNVYKSRSFLGATSMQYSNTVKFTLSAAILGFLALGLASAPAVAQADPATTTFGVSATVLKDCIVSATAMAFGNYTGAVNTSTSTVTVTCTNTTTYTVGLGPGLATGATVTTRQMQNGAALLNYGLFSNGTWTTNWGNTSVTNWVSGTGNGAAQNLTVYGQIPAGQYVTPGSYADTIAVTVTY
jgi:spore coat protein U-like protein